jgi:hypothetical protein
MHLIVWRGEACEESEVETGDRTLREKGHIGTGMCLVQMRIATTNDNETYRETLTWSMIFPSLDGLGTAIKNTSTSLGSENSTNMEP